MRTSHYHRTFNSISSCPAPVPFLAKSSRRLLLPHLHLTTAPSIFGSAFALALSSTTLIRAGSYRCSTHRVQGSRMPLGEQTVSVRLCNSCAFSSSHPEHLGCKNPWSCPRCGIPKSGGQWLIFARTILSMLLCGICCCGCECIGASCLRTLDMRSRPAPRLVSFGGAKNSTQLGNRRSHSEPLAYPVTDVVLP